MQHSGFQFMCRKENGGAVYSRDVDNTFIFHCIQDRNNPVITHHRLFAVICTVSTPRIQSDVNPECMQTPAQQGNPEQVTKAERRT